jgi:hypothetical protein
MEIDNSSSCHHMHTFGIASNTIKVYYLHKVTPHTTLRDRRPAMKVISGFCIFFVVFRYWIVAAEGRDSPERRIK